MDAPFPVEGTSLYVSTEGRLLPSHQWDTLRPTAILPGAFDPLHAGHRGLANAAADLLAMPVAFELSVSNVDKRFLDAVEVERRLIQFSGWAAAWLTRAPRFTDKAEIFPGATFVVGADTALRIVDPCYYHDDAEKLHAALARVEERACRFLVACRVDCTGRCIELDDIAVPSAFRQLFAAIPSNRFRLDLSSTTIRACGGHTP
jgi:hypothetical protein